MRNKFLAPVLAGLSVVALAAVSNASIINYSVALSGPNESPANASPGVGSGTVAYDTTLHTLALSLSFSGLTGTTTASHIHAATAVADTGTAGVATTTPTFAGFPLGVTSGTYTNTLDLTLASSYNPAYVTANGGTTASAELALISALNTDKAYWNVHTSTFPGGEIRGFVTAVPEPTSFAAVGLGGLALVRRRTRRA